MKILSLKVRNFLSIRKANVCLADRGILMITGRNLDNPASSSNGAGKSALWDALVWGLYGKPIRPIAVDSVYRSRAELRPMWVLLDLCDGNGIRWRLKRSKKDTGSNPRTDLLCDGKDVSGQTGAQTQAKIEQLLGMDHQTFCSSILFGQETLRFAKATDKEKKTILEKLLNLQQYEKAGKLAHRSLTGHKMTLGLTNASYEKAKERIESLTTEIKTYRSRLKRDEETSLRNQGETKKEIERLQHRLKRLTKRKRRQEEKKEKHQRLLAKLEDCDMSASNSKEEYENLMLEERGLHKQLVDLRDSKNPRCPTCSQTLEGDSKLKTAKQIQSAIDANAEKTSGIGKSYRRWLKLRKRIRRKIKTFGAEKIELRLTKLGGALQKTSSGITSLEAQLHLSKRNQSYNRGALKVLKRQFKKTKRELRTCSKDSKRILRKIKYAEFWEKAFGTSGIRSYLLDNITPYLNARAKDYSQVLTDGLIKIEFSTVSRLRSGDVVDKFSIQVSGGKGAKEYSAYSAGEQQRIDLCVALALKDLARSRSKGKLDLMIFDEAFERLDETGCQKVIELLNQEKDKFGSCFIITHNDNLKPFFSQRLEAVKQNGVTTYKEVS
jgi:DNA repair exonuclease SbcCD ATPase subunit